MQPTRRDALVTIAGLAATSTAEAQTFLTKAVARVLQKRFVFKYLQRQMACLGSSSMWLPIQFGCSGQLQIIYTQSPHEVTGTPSLVVLEGF
jgi:hypothetical protein